MRWFKFQLNLTHLPRHEYVPGVGMGIAKCPYDPADNSTAVWVSHGNPGELPALYAGTNAEFTHADPVIFRTDLYELNTGKKWHNYKRTIKYDSKWLDSKFIRYNQSNVIQSDWTRDRGEKWDQRFTFLISHSKFNPATMNWYTIYCYIPLYNLNGRALSVETARKRRH